MRANRTALRRLRNLGTPAATVALLRDATCGPEVLLLQKSKGQRFGELWVFPGGKIDQVDTVLYTDSPVEDVLATAARAAAREAAEEAQVAVLPRQLCFFSHWLPPPLEAARRGKALSTFFFAGRAATARVDEVHVDGLEISNHEWVRPADALTRHAQGLLGLLPPTWITLDVLAAFSNVDAALSALGSAEPVCYETRLGKLKDGRTCYMWAGDAGWPSSEPTVPGPRHRLVEAPLSSSMPPSALTGLKESGAEELRPLTRGLSTLALERDCGLAGALSGS